MAYDMNPMVCNFIGHGDTTLVDSDKTGKNLCAEPLMGFHKEAERQDYVKARRDFGLGTVGTFIGWTGLALDVVNEISSNDDFSLENLIKYDRLNNDLTVKHFARPTSGTLDDQSVSKDECRALHYAKTDGYFKRKIDKEEKFAQLSKSDLSWDQIMCKYMYHNQNDKKGGLATGMKWFSRFNKLYSFTTGIASFTLSAIALQSAEKRWDNINGNKCTYSFSFPESNIYLCNRQIGGPSRSEYRCFLNYDLKGERLSAYRAVRLNNRYVQTDRKFISIYGGIELYKAQGSMSDTLSISLSEKIAKILMNETLGRGIFNKTTCNHFLNGIVLKDDINTTRCSITTDEIGELRSTNITKNQNCQVNLKESYSTWVSSGLTSGKSEIEKGAELSNGLRFGGNGLGGNELVISNSNCLLMTKWAQQGAGIIGNTNDIQVSNTVFPNLFNLSLQKSLYIRGGWHCDQLSMQELYSEVTQKLTDFCLANGLLGDIENFCGNW